MVTGMWPRERGILPAGLEDTAPGRELGDKLASVDRRRLNGHELVTLLEARARQVAHLQAEMYADMWELALTPPGDVDSPPVRRSTIDEFVREEIAASLHLTMRSADIHLSLAFGLARLPRVWTALHCGEIDVARARVLCHETSHLETDEANRVVAAVIDDAVHLTTGQLAARTRRRCIETDPDAARRRHEAGLAGRRLEAFPNDDGTADLLGRQLPADRVASIMARIRSIAATLAGADDRRMDQIRADILLDLLEGRSEYSTIDAAGVEIRVDLTTLLELDDRAGEIPGWGPIIADTARRVTDDQIAGRWTMIVTDPETGDPIWTGVTRRRPTAAQQRHVRARNRTCVFPGCRTPSLDSQIDHTRPAGRGGPTAVANLGPVCARHHLGVKHRAGWHLAQPVPGTFEWTSPRARRYTVRPDPP